jgi:chemotaxis protein methyltransferase CheR
MERGSLTGMELRRPDCAPPDGGGPPAPLSLVPSAAAQPALLRPREFQAICALLYRVCGIHLQPGKEQLVQSRLWKRIRGLGLRDFSQYLRLVEGATGAAELDFMVDALTTNKTSFFRESAHFDYLRDQLRGAQAARRRCRIWCAGCSTGQEAYTLAVCLHESVDNLAGRDFRILATDISERVLEKCRKGLYEREEMAEMPAELARRHFRTVKENGRDLYAAGNHLRRLVHFERLNLMEPWPMKGPFDFIFCRNVMIYFDRSTQQNLVERFRTMLCSGGHLLVGHSESLTGRSRGFDYIMPAVYRRAA